MMILSSVFLFNLFCGFFNCDPNFEPPTKGLSARNGRELRNVRMEKPQVTLKDGMLEGYIMTTINGRKIYAFEGIPFGQYTGGSNRWKPPKKNRPWSGILKANKPGPDCLQLSISKMNRIYGSEDCLYLNVYTPDLRNKRAQSSKYPVVVYLHGGAFLLGAGSEHGPSYFLDEDIVLVTINYRLGVLGFLSTGDLASPGNYGLKDQALALEWVHDNILMFGGDPDNVNLWGSSAGAASIHCHMMANKTRHLFKRGVSQSGTASNFWSVLPEERLMRFAREIAKQFSCPTEESYALVDCLKSLDPNFLVAAQRNLFKWFVFPATMFAPTVEPDHATAFLTETSEQAYENGHVAAKPWIAGTTSREGQTARMVMELYFRYGQLILNWESLAKYLLDFAHLSNNPDLVTKQITEYYVGNKSIREADGNRISEMITDRFFHFGVVNALKQHSNVAPTYGYYFSFSQGRYNLGNYASHDSQEWGPGHAEDDYYFFNSSKQHASFTVSDPEYGMSRTMMNFMVNFFKTSTPFYTDPKTKENLSIWEPVNKTDLKVIQFDSTVKMIRFPHQERLKFWASLDLNDTVMVE